MLLKTTLLIWRLVEVQLWRQQADLSAEYQKTDAMGFSRVQNIKKFYQLQQEQLSQCYVLLNPYPRHCDQLKLYIMALGMNEEKLFSAGISTHFSHAVWVKTPVAECK